MKIEQLLTHQCPVVRDLAARLIAGKNPLILTSYKKIYHRKYHSRKWIRLEQSKKYQHWQVIIRDAVITSNVTVQHINLIHTANSWCECCGILT